MAESADGDVTVCDSKGKYVSLHEDYVLHTISGILTKEDTILLNKTKTNSLFNSCVADGSVLFCLIARTYRLLCKQVQIKIDVSFVYYDYFKDSAAASNNI